MKGFFRLTRTFMELKLHSMIGITKRNRVLLVPLWNWNTDVFRDWLPRFYVLLVPLWNWNCHILIIWYNDTQSYSYLYGIETWRLLSLACMPRKVLLVPLWNWNIFLLQRIKRDEIVLLVPLWNWNSVPSAYLMRYSVSYSYLYGIETWHRGWLWFGACRLTRTFMELKHESVDYIDDVKASYSYLYKIRTAFNIDWRAGAHHQAERCGDRAKPTVHVASRQRKKGEMHNQPTQKALQMGLFELKKTVKEVNTKLIRICRWGCSSLRR